jgi:hypothetical protein
MTTAINTREAAAATPGNELSPDSALPHVIPPAAHAVLDYGVAGTFIVTGAAMLSRNRSAAALALLNGMMVLGLALFTDYPGGVFRKISFRVGHRTGDAIQAALAGLGPVLFGFGRDAEARFFYGQAASEVGVIGMTDWDGVRR